MSYLARYVLVYDQENDSSRVIPAKGSYSEAMEAISELSAAGFEDLRIDDVFGVMAVLGPSEEILCVEDVRTPGYVSGQARYARPKDRLLRD